MERQRLRKGMGEPLVMKNASPAAVCEFSRLATARTCASATLVT